jgi:hypothetical protein
MSESDIVAAHKHCSRHRNEIIASDCCGCFHCLEIFDPEKIIGWIDEPKDAGQTAVCPICGIDSVIGSNSAFPITREFLGAMNAHWF